MAETGFQLKGNAAQDYERYNVPRIVRPMAEAMFEHVVLRDGDRVLDAACGTGVVTRVAVERRTSLASIVGFDFNAGMLDVARANTPVTDIPVEWQQGDICALPFPASSFDVVLCQQGLQFAPDKPAALAHMRRVLTPDGRLAFSVWSDANPLTAAAADAVRRHINDEAAAGLLSPYALADARIVRKLVDEAGFHAIEMLGIESPIRWPATAHGMAEFMTVTAARSPFTRELTEAHAVLVEEVMAALQRYREGDAFVMTAHSHLVQARA
jgi:SAM-dependent methyltransferase